VGFRVLCKYFINIAFTDCYIIAFGAWVGVVVKAVPGSIPGGVTGFFNDIFLSTVPWPWGRLSP
jgi:hypothetical protein